jgi:hypothetical protein
MNIRSCFPAARRWSSDVGPTERRGWFRGRISRWWPLGEGSSPRSPSKSVALPGAPWHGACGPSLLLALLLAGALAAPALSSPEWGQAIRVGATAGPSGGTIYQGLGVDSAGTLHATWMEYQAGFDIFYSRSFDGGASWEAGRDLLGSALPVYSPNLAVGPDDSLHLAWVDRREGGETIYYARSTDGGDHFDAPRRISAAGTADVGPPAIGVDLEGRVHVAYHVGNPDVPSPTVTSWYVRSLDGGASWSTPLRLDQSTGHAAFPRFDVTGVSGDHLAIAWRDQRRKPDWDVYLAVSDDGGASFSERVGEAGDEYEWDPTAAVDPGGRLHLSYMTYRQPEDGGVTIDYRRAESLGAGFGPEITLSQGHSRFPFWANDHAHGRLWLFWKDERDLGTAACPGPEHCADVATRYSNDHGSTWSDLELITDLGVVETKFPSPAVGPDGRAHVVWSDTSSGVERLYVASRIAAPDDGGGGGGGGDGDCVPDEETLCLGGRWAVTVGWATGAGTSGTATPHPLVADTGAFWFFRPENLELVVKVLDGCVVNGHAWVFASGLTNVAVEITVTDTATGAVWTHTSAAGPPFAPVQDTAAFDCP